MSTISLQGFGKAQSIFYEFEGDPEVFSAGLAVQGEELTGSSIIERVVISPRKKISRQEIEALTGPPLETSPTPAATDGRKTYFARYPKGHLNVSYFEDTDEVRTINVVSERYVAQPPQ